MKRPDVRIEEAEKFVEAWHKVPEITGIPMPTDVDKILIRAFLAGYDHAMERGYQELLAENETLQNTLVMHESQPGRMVALEALVDFLEEETVLHEEQCECCACIALEQLNKRLNVRK